jgi:hypothetical protein
MSNSLIEHIKTGLRLLGPNTNLLSYINGFIIWSIHICTYVVCKLFIPTYLVPKHLVRYMDEDSYVSLKYETIIERINFK